MMICLLLLPMLASSSQDSIWPSEAPPLNLGAIDAAPDSAPGSNLGRHFFDGDLSITMRDDKRAADGLQAIYRAVPPMEAFHDEQLGKERIHPSKIRILISDRAAHLRRTYATEDGPLSIAVYVFNDPAAADEYIQKRITGGAGSNPDLLRSPAFTFGDASWVPMDAPGSAFVRDGRVVIDVTLANALKPDSFEYLESVVQAVRFRLIVASRLIVGGVEQTVEVRPGVSVNVRDFEGTKMVCLQELEAAGYSVESTSVNLVRSCTLGLGSKSLVLTEYRMGFVARGRITAMPVAAFAFDGDLWLPLASVTAELED